MPLICFTFGHRFELFGMALLINDGSLGRRAAIGDHATVSDTGSPHGEGNAEASDDPDAILEALWKRVLEAWDDDKPHQAALTYALQNEKLPDIAGRYRSLLEDPEKSVRAKRKIDAIVVAATQLLMATKTAPREKVPWQWTASVAAAFVLVVTFLAYKVFLRR